MKALEKLIAEAEAAPVSRRIELRDPIAAYGVEAVNAVEPWLKDEQMAAFAVRVLGRICGSGATGEAADAAARMLRSAKRRASPAIAGDIDWELGQARAARLAPASPRTTPPARAVAAPKAPRRARSSVSTSHVDGSGAP